MVPADAGSAHSAKSCEKLVEELPTGPSTELAIVEFASVPSSYDRRDDYRG